MRVWRLQVALLPTGWDAEAARVDSIGWLYVPARCSSLSSSDIDDDGHGSGATCDVHVHYHCCACNWKTVSTTYMLQSGL